LLLTQKNLTRQNQFLFKVAEEVKASEKLEELGFKTSMN
jgi:hypothetical protein